MKRLVVTLVAASFAATGFACNIAHDAPADQSAEAPAKAGEPRKNAGKAVKPQQAKKAAAGKEGSARR